MNKRNSKGATGERAATRRRILDAALEVVAKKGAATLALTDVVRLSGVHRATVYQHFRTRNDLIMATSERFSSRFYKAVHGDTQESTEVGQKSLDIVELSTRFADFVMENPDLCRIWLYNILSSPDPAKDSVWKEYEGSFRRLFSTSSAQQQLDSEVTAVLVLAGGILWPLWARAHTTSRAERKALARRFADSLLRLAMFGAVRPECFPDIAAYLKNSDRRSEGASAAPKASKRKKS
jgi:AcrR family transcriptional regulator